MGSLSLATNDEESNSGRNSVAIQLVYYVVVALLRRWSRRNAKTAPETIKPLNAIQSINLADGGVRPPVSGIPLGREESGNAVGSGTGMPAVPTATIKAVRFLNRLLS